jgi:hypothetical protein
VIGHLINSEKALEENGSSIINILFQYLTRGPEEKQTTHQDF